MAATNPCDICVAWRTGYCVRNNTCICYEGRLGISCQDPVTTPAPSQTNAPIIIASVLSGVLFTLIVGLVVFFLWKRRVKKKKSVTLTTTTPTAPPPEPVVTPALYNLTLSRADSPQTISYHLYDELP